MIVHAILIGAQLLAPLTRDTAQIKPTSGGSTRASAVLGTLGALSAAAIFDERIAGYFERHRSAGLDDLADAVDPFGRARVLVPSLVVTWVAARTTGREGLANAVIRIAAGYFAADAAGGALKLAVGRHRPDSTNDAWRFHGFRRGHEWHSFPSGHVYHAFAIASGVADEVDWTWVTTSAYGLATVVGLQRVYTRAHWASDVVGGVVVGVGVSRYVRRRVWPRTASDGSGNPFRTIVTPGAIAVSVTF